jgi:hypothetical protein
MLLIRAYFHSASSPMCFFHSAHSFIVLIFIKHIGDKAQFLSRLDEKGKKTLNSTVSVRDFLRQRA